MGMAAAQPRQDPERHQRHTAGGRLPRAAHHLHGRHAPCSRRASPCSSPRPTNPDKKPEGEQAEGHLGQYSSPPGYYLDEQADAEGELQKQLEELFQRAPQTDLVIKADQRLKYGEVKEVMRSRRKPGFQNVGLIAQKKQTAARQARPPSKENHTP